MLDRVAITAVRSGAALSPTAASRQTGRATMPQYFIGIRRVCRFMALGLSLVSVFPLQAAAPLKLAVPPAAAARDYILPGPGVDLSPRITPYSPSEAEQTAFACSDYCGTTVNYTAWNGTAYVMQEFVGRKMRVLIPQAWFDVPSFTADTRRRFVDAIDLNYQYATEVAGGEPSGTGLNTIAFVNPTGCGGYPVIGCGGVGAKGIEILNDATPGNNAHYWQTTDNDSVSDNISHEMGHNFDIYGFSTNANLGSNSDAAHFYVYMLGHAATYDYSHDAGESAALSSREFALQQESQTFYAYRGVAGATWQACGANGTCGMEANRVLAAPLYRARQLYGRAAYARFLNFYKARLASTPPATMQDRMDLLFEAYSAAANRNLLCLLDTFQWPISAAARARVNTAYPQANPDCTQPGANGQPVILGDPLYSGITGAAPYDNSAATEWLYVNAPARITGRTLAGRDSFFEVPNLTNSHVRVFYCSAAGTGTTAHVLYWVGGTTLYGSSFVTPVRGACTLGFYHQKPVNSDPFMLGATGVTAANEGAYTVSIAKEPYSPRRWADLVVSRNPATGALTFSVANVDETLVESGAQAVRYWVQGRGWVASASWSGNRMASWQPAANEDVSGLVMRAQVYGIDGPVSNRSKPVVYRLDRIFGNGYE
ncbi:MAG: hypothetical protein JNN30_04420 [Rhodanobacteraceae bacterium]|nr:hypothetical protein [Rhodanobacteraceae bacterium]